MIRRQLIPLKMYLESTVRHLISEMPDGFTFYVAASLSDLTQDQLSLTPLQSTHLLLFLEYFLSATNVPAMQKRLIAIMNR